MGAEKRANRDEVGSPASSVGGKKLKKGHEGSGQTTAGKMDGPDDTFIRDLFSVLFYAILSFSVSYFKGAPWVSPRKQHQKDFVESLTASGAKLYLQGKHAGAKEKIVQAMIWNKLMMSLLGMPLKAFLQFPEVTMQTYMTGEDAPDFYMWRTMTARILQNSYKGPLSWGKDGPRRKDFINETTELLSNLSVVNDQDTMETGLDGIAQHAYNLATAMATSGAYWVCTMKDPDVGKLHGFKIKRGRMEDMEFWEDDEETGKSSMVDLVVSPMLLRYGNSAGRDFDKCQVVEKAKVVMKPKDI